MHLPGRWPLGTGLRQWPARGPAGGVGIGVGQTASCCQGPSAVPALFLLTGNQRGGWWWAWGLACGAASRPGVRWGAAGEVDAAGAPRSSPGEHAGVCRERSGLRSERTELREKREARRTLPHVWRGREKS